MRVEFDEEQDRAIFVLVDERQTHEGGYTEAMYVFPDDSDPLREPGVLVLHPAKAGA